MKEQDKKILNIINNYPLIVDMKAGIMYTWRSIQYNICSLSDERIDKIERYLKRVKNA